MDRPTAPPTSGVPEALEEELYELRASVADIRRERVALESERAHMTARAGELERELAASQQERDREHAEWAQQRTQLEEQRAAAEQELVVLRQRIASAERVLRWSPRHWLGVLAHRSSVVRRLRSGRD